MTMQRIIVGIAAALVLGTSNFAIADDDGDDHHNRREGGSRSTLQDPAYQKECGSCHLAFPPSMLSAGNWQKLMGGLAKHFGENAELPAAQAAPITEYLTRNAGNSARTESASLRITDTEGFRRKHREVPKRALKPQGQVGSLTDCSACHTRAKEGSFQEREIQIPGMGRWE